MHGPSSRSSAQVSVVDHEAKQFGVCCLSPQPKGVIKIRLRNVFTAAAIVQLSVVPLAAAKCPPAVTAAVQQAHAGVAIVSCKQEQEKSEIGLASMPDKKYHLTRLVIRN